MPYRGRATWRASSRLPCSRSAVLAPLAPYLARVRLHTFDLAPFGRDRARGAWPSPSHSRSRSRSRSSSRRGWTVVPVHVPEVPPGLDDVAHAALELLCLGEAAVDLAVPEDGAGRGGGGGAGHCRSLVLVLRAGHSNDTAVSLVDDCDDEGAARGGLQGDFPQGEAERGEQLLGVLST